MRIGTKRDRDMSTGTQTQPHRTQGTTTSLAEHITRCEVKHAYRQGRRPSNHAPLELELEGLDGDCTESAIAA